MSELDIDRQLVVLRVLTESIGLSSIGFANLDIGRIMTDIIEKHGEPYAQGLFFLAQKILDTETIRKPIVEFNAGHNPKIPVRTVIGETKPIFDSRGAWARRNDIASKKMNKGGFSKAHRRERYRGPGRHSR